MYITEDGGRNRRIPFGADVRGFRIVELEIGVNDIKNMLQMHEHELKDRLYEVMCAMVSDREYRNRNRGSRDNNRYDEERYRQMQTHAKRHKVSWDPTDPCAAVPDHMTQKNNGRPEPIPDFSEVFKSATSKKPFVKHTTTPVDGLIWTDE